MKHYENYYSNSRLSNKINNKYENSVAIDDMHFGRNAFSN